MKTYKEEWASLVVTGHYISVLREYDVMSTRNITVQVAGCEEPDNM